MAGIYLHIPFCKTKCPYCDFFSVTNTREVHRLVEALGLELDYRKDYLGGEKISTVYFGGGTPSLLDMDQLSFLLEVIHSKFPIDEAVEFTVECNPDDLSKTSIGELKYMGFNRISIGVQRFDDEVLVFLGRRHTAAQNEWVLEQVFEKGFDNVSIDLIYGIPGISNARWEADLQKAFRYPYKHLSAYHLTIEPHTPFGQMEKQGKLTMPSEETSVEAFRLLISYAGYYGFEHYELSNFARPGYLSKHNTSYWQQIPYLGIGPSAHSYNGTSRQWNVASIKFYLDALYRGCIPCKQEILSTRDLFNEWIITRLRTRWGVSPEEIGRKFGTGYQRHLMEQSAFFLQKGYMDYRDDHMVLTNEGKLISNIIFRELMWV
jgi:putative oxygen-independent coproporphyrinogen III oxidase